MNQEQYIYILILYLLLINLIGFFIMKFDKKRAINRKWRISESKIFLVAALFGSLGELIGMYKFRHKTKHTKFVIGIPLILLLQLIILVIGVY